MQRHDWATWTLIAALSGPTAAASHGEQPRPTGFSIARHGHVVVPIRVNGKGPFQFILDTGSSHTSIAASLAARLGARPVARAMVTTALAQEFAIVVGLERLELGPLTKRELLATSVADAAIAAIDDRGDVLGIIGQDVLAAECYTLDFENRRIAWNVAASNVRGERLPLNREEGRFLVALPQPGGVLHLVPDSGAETLVLFDRGSQRLPPHERTRLQSRLETVNDRAEVEQIRLFQLHIGSTSWLNQPAFIVNRRTQPASPADGLLPLHGFSRVTFDGPGGAIVFETAAGS